MANANTRVIPRTELVEGNIVHFYGARFEIVSTRLIDDFDGVTDKPCKVMVADGKWIDGEVIPGYFGPGKNFNFQGNRFASAVIEIPEIPAGMIDE